MENPGYIRLGKEQMRRGGKSDPRNKSLMKMFNLIEYMVEISKSDWKLFRERVPEWQEHYMERLTKKYMEILSSPGNASDHFWELEKRIKQDRKHPGVILEVRRSDAIWNIAILISKKVITTDDLEGFSQDLIDAVNLILSR